MDIRTAFSDEHLFYLWMMDTCDFGALERCISDRYGRRARIVDPSGRPVLESVKVLIALHAIGTNIVRVVF